MINQRKRGKLGRIVRTGYSALGTVEKEEKTLKENEKKKRMKG